MPLKLSLEARNQIVTILSQQESWWKLEGRFSLMKEAGLQKLIPHLVLETTPFSAASHLISYLVDGGFRPELPALLRTANGRAEEGQPFSDEILQAADNA